MCIRDSDYDVNDVVRNPNTAIPDILYYWRFLRQLFTQRPYLVKGFSKNDFVHYHCYDEEGRLFKKPRCSLSRRDIQEFVSNVTLKDKQDWNYICFQLDYDVNDVVRNPNTAIPDIFYYWRFWRQLITKRPYLVKGYSKKDFVHYNCYNKKGRLHEKELVRKYFVVFIIAVLLWLYSPCLLYTSPSPRDA